VTRRTALLLAGARLCGAQYKNARKSPPTFEGPGRELPEPAGVREVLIGYYGPSEESHPDGGILWQGAAMALEEINREGGYKGIPFRLVSRWMENPWSGGAALITRMAFVDRVWIIIGSIDGAGTHLAEQVVVKALLPLINPVATDRSIHMAGVAWMFSLVQGDHLHAALLGEALRGRQVTLLSATDHDSRAFVGSLKTAFGREDVKIRAHTEFEAGRAGTGVEMVQEPAVVIADARAGAKVVKALRAAGYADAIAGGPWFGRAAFLEAAEAAAEGVLFPWVGAPDEGFARRFAARFRWEPDYAAACAFDSGRLAAAAVRKGGLNRARMRDALQQLSGYAGASGRIEWDEFGQNRRPPVLATIRSGRVTVPAFPGKSSR
jgi:ABC-type branched-subunit amino acid transport system substrate-binding protein